MSDTDRMKIAKYQRQIERLEQEVAQCPGNQIVLAENTREIGDLKDRIGRISRRLRGEEEPGLATENQVAQMESFFARLESGEYDDD